MPPKNDIFQTFDLKWSMGYKPCDDVVAKVDYIEQTDAGLKIHCHKIEKEKKMNKNEEFKNASSISIEKNYEENTVSATLYGRQPVTNEPYIIKTCKATCDPNDIFDFNIGAKLALDRLYEGYDMTPKPKRKPYNGLIYIEKYPGLALKDKSIYRVKGGVIQTCPFGVRPFIYEGMSDEELSTEIDDVVWGRNTVNFCLTPGEENKYPLTVAHFVDNDQTR